MSSTMKAPAADNAASELQTVLSDIAALRADVAKLASHLSGSAINATSAAARGTADKISADATRIYDTVAEQAGRSAKAIGRQVELQPVASLLVAFALGYVGSRLMARPIS